MTRIKSLDGWRAISILLVVVGHLVNYRYGSAENHLSSLASYCAQLGVKVFFVISGFLITSISLKEEAAAHSFSARNFYLRRLFRIMPAYLAYLLGIAALAMTGQVDQDLNGIGRAAAFTCNVPQRECGWFANHSWSLAYEQQFYLLFPLAFMLTLGMRRRWLTAIHLIVVATPFIALGLPQGAQDLCLFVSRFGSITMGVLLACHAHRLQGLAGSRKLLLGALAAGTLLIIVVGLNALHLSYGVRAAIDGLILPPVVAWLIFASISATGAIARILNNKGVAYLGSISYSLYLWQQLFTATPSRYTHPTCFNWLLMLPAAALSYQFVEKPFIRWGRQVTERRKRSGIDINLRRPA